MKQLLLIGCILFIGSWGTHSKAADLKSIAQQTAQISAHISQLQKADFTSTEPTNKTIVSRSLRHIYIQARTNFSNINSLRIINGLEAKSPPVLALKKWTEADIEAILTAQMESLKDLNIVYNITTEPTDLKPVKASIDDIFIAFLNIEEQLKSLGIPGQGPGDSFQYANMLVQTVKQLAKHMKVRVPRPSDEKINDKRPNDNYLYALSVAAELQYYQTEYLKKDIPGGVLIPNSKEGKASSGDTIEVIKTVLADLVALKLAVGDSTALKITEADMSRTPSDVYKQLVFAYDIIFAMEDAIAAGEGS